VEIGRHSGVYNGSFFNLGPLGRVRIADYCTLVGAIISTDGEVEIGDHALIAHQVVIADRPAATPPSCGAQDTGRIVIGPNAWICARAILLTGADIGEDAVVGAAAVVDGPVPPGAIVAGNPARVVGWVKGRR
jgi:acetyltransferase-like isoleucine patch superfamily enzyme